MKRIALGVIAAIIILGCLAWFAPSARAQVTYPNRGGTGASSTPALGDVLVGCDRYGVRVYCPQATSTLGFISLAALSDYLTLSAWYATTTDGLDEGATNLYFTLARARAAISETIAGIDYSNLTGVFSITSGYGIPTTAKQTEWDTAFGWGNHASQGYITDGNTGWDNIYNLFDKDIDDTGDITEGSNLFYTAARATANFIANLSATTSVASITSLPNLSITEAQISDLDHYTDGDVQAYLNTVAKTFFFSTTSANYWETQQTARTADDLTNNSIEDLSDVAAITENYGDLLGWNGSAWTDFATSSLGLPTFGYPFPGNATNTAITFSGGIVGNVTGNSSTATALASNGANCSLGSAPLGVDASGAVENCFDVWTEAENTSAAYAPQARQLTVAGTANQITSSAGAQSLAADRTWTLSLPSHVAFPGSYFASSGSTTNSTSTTLWVLGGIRDANNLEAINPTQHALYDSSGVGVVDWENLNLVDASAQGSIAWGVRTLSNNTNQPVLDWQNLVAIDSTGGNSIDWATRALMGSDGTTPSVNWAAPTALVFGSYNCSGNANDGKLTVDASGNVVCADDVSGGGSVDAFEIATTSDIAVPELAYFTETSGRTTLGSVGTTSLTATSPLSLSEPISVLGAAASALSISTAGDWTGTLDGLEASDFEQDLTAGDGLTRTGNDFDCDTASGSVFGCLSSSDWTTFNNKLSAAVTAIGPTAQTADGPTVTFATSTSAFNGLTPNLVITGSGDTLTFTSSLSGTLGNAGLTNSSVSYGGVSLSLGGSDATPAFNLVDATGLPIGTGVSGLGTGVATALGVNVGSAGAFVVNGGALGTPSSGTLTNATGLPIDAGTTGTLTVARGGTGSTTAPVGQVLYGGASAYQSAATSTLTGNSQIAVSQTAYVIGPSAPVLSIVADSIGDTQLAFNTGQNLTTASSPSFTGLTIGTLNGIIKGTTGVLSAATAGTDYVAGGTGANTQVTYFTGSGAIAGDAGMTYDASADRLTVVNASTTRMTASYASSTSWYGGGLTTDCDTGATSKLLWDATTGQFSCGTDQGGAGGSPGGSTGQLQFNNAGAFGGIADSAWNTAGFLGIGSTTPWGFLSISSSTWSDYTRPVQIFATSSNPYGQLNSLFATTSEPIPTNPSLFRSVVNGTRFLIGTISQYGYVGGLDHLFGNIRINTGDMQLYECLGGNVTGVTADIASGCGDFSFMEDAAASLLAGTVSSYPAPVFNIFLAASAVSDGGAVAIGGIYPATSTPVLEALADRGGVGGADRFSTSTALIGFTNVAITGSTMDIPTAGCYFSASSTQANWMTVCHTSAATFAGIVDSGVSTTTNAFTRFRVEMDGTRARFYVQEANADMRLVTQMSGAGYPATTQLNAGMITLADAVANTSTSGTSLTGQYLKLWLRSVFTR